MKKILATILISLCLLATSCKKEYKPLRIEVYQMTNVPYFISYQNIDNKGQVVYQDTTSWGAYTIIYTPIAKRNVLHSEGGKIKISIQSESLNLDTIVSGNFDYNWDNQ